MIKHVVMWKLKDFAEGCDRKENANKIKTLLEGLKDKIEQIVYLEVGVNLNDSNMAFDAVLISEFQDMLGLEIYKNHPEHLKVADFVAKVRLDRAVVDYLMQGN